jgi:preprotein translocase subunit SecD
LPVLLGVKNEVPQWIYSLFIVFLLVLLFVKLYYRIVFMVHSIIKLTFRFCYCIVFHSWHIYEWIVGWKQWLLHMLCK